MRVCDFECFEYFYKTLIFAFVVGFCYDLLKCTFCRSKMFRDIIFTIFSALMTLFFMINIVGGCIRWYVIVTALSGLILYFFAVSKIVCIFLLFFTKKLTKFLQFIFKILLTVTHFFGKIIPYISKWNFVRNYRRGIDNEKDKI